MKKKGLAGEALEGEQKKLASVLLKKKRDKEQRRIFFRFKGERKSWSFKKGGGKESFCKLRLKVAKATRGPSCFSTFGFPFHFLYRKTLVVVMEIHGC